MSTEYDATRAMIDRAFGDKDGVIVAHDLQSLMASTQAIIDDPNAPPEQKEVARASQTFSKFIDRWFRDCVSREVPPPLVLKCAEIMAMTIITSTASLVAKPEGLFAAIAMAGANVGHGCINMFHTAEAKKKESH